MTVPLSLPVPFPAEIATPLLLIALVCSATLLMLQLAVGPFGHPRFIHLHQAYLRWPEGLRRLFSGIAAVVIFSALTHLSGLWQFTPQ
jgi:hypothetical protein